MPDYEPKAILLTGGAGFIGSFVCIHLVKKYPQYKLICLDSMEYCASIKNLDPIINEPNFHLVKGSIANSELVRHVLVQFKIDTIMNFAAQSHVDMSFGNSLEFTKTNVVGTHVLLECAREQGELIKRFIHVSTDEVYGEVLGEAAMETAQFEPTNPYSCSKAAAEIICKSYVRSFKMPIIITRGNNVYGPRQYPEKVIPKFIMRLLRGDKCCLHGDGSAQRTYVYAQDVALGFDTVLHKGENNQVYNVGSHADITMKQLAITLIRHLGLTEEGQEETLIEYVEDRKFNDQRYAIDTSKLNDLGWTPSTSFEEGLKMTIDWYKSMDPEHWPEFLSALASHPLAGRVQTF